MVHAAKYATLCLLITYHWHASWAVSTWPSGGAGIAAEVNGSPADARLNIPVVKRSSNQAELANEPPHPGVVHGDSRGSFVQGGGLALSVSTAGGHPSLEYMEGMTRLENSRKGMIEGSFVDSGDESVRFQDGTIKKWPKDDNGGKGTSEGQLIAERIIRPRFQRRSFHHQKSFGSASREKRSVEKRSEDQNGDKGEMKQSEFRGVFEQRKTGDDCVASEEKMNGLVLANVETPSGPTGPKGTNQNTNQNIPNASKIYRLQTSNQCEDVDKRPVGYSVDSHRVARLLDSSRLHQQSRNSKPRTIVQHLRGDRQTNEVKIRFYERPVVNDQRYRRQQGTQYPSSFTKLNGNSNQLRFIPFYNSHTTKNRKSSRHRETNGDHVDQTIDDSYQLGRDNITNFSTLEDEADIQNLRESLNGVFDRHLTAEGIQELPNVRAILPKRVFVASPKLIYDTKILPAPFSLDKYFQNLGTNDGSNNGEKSHQPGSPMKGLFDPDRITADYEQRPAIATANDPRELVTNSQNYVTPPTTGTGQFPSGVNQLESSLVSSRPDGTYDVRELGDPEMPLSQPQLKTFEHDMNLMSPNRESPSKTGGHDPSRETGSSYDSGIAHASNDQSTSGSPDQTTVIATINDEYANHETASYSDVANIGSGVTTRTSQKRGQQRDHRYTDGRNNWRGHDDNDHSRYVAKYSFGYLVNDDDSHNDFGHQEMRNEGITKGRYHVRLPDGRIQKVNYQVDDGGYRANVSYRHNVSH